MGLLFDDPPQSYSVLDEQLHCQVCGHDEFHHREVLLRSAELFNIDWGDRPVMCFTCDRCGYIHWFVKK